MFAVFGRRTLTTNEHVRQCEHVRVFGIIFFHFNQISITLNKSTDLYDGFNTELFFLLNEKKHLNIIHMFGIKKLYAKMY